MRNRHSIASFIILYIQVLCIYIGTTLTYMENYCDLSKTIILNFFFLNASVAQIMPEMEVLISQLFSGSAPPAI